jgi:hypothetical protein
VYDELTLGEEAVDVSPSQALDKAEYFLVGQGYVSGRRTATTLTVEREGLARRRRRRQKGADLDEFLRISHSPGPTPMSV